MATLVCGAGEGRGHTLTGEHVVVCHMSLSWWPWRATHLAEADAFQHKEGRVELGQVDYQSGAHVQRRHLHGT